MDVVLEMAKDPGADLPILEMAVEKIKEVQEAKDEDVSIIDPVIEKEVTSMPIEIVLEMAQDPEAKEEVLNIAVIKLEEAIEEKMSELPLEDVLEMAKDPNADDHVLEMAVKKIAEAQDVKTKEEPYTHENEADIQSLAKELPMEILLEMVKEPETKTQY
eukprot:TRINITY_DN24710_c0_g1_i1.p1 TRINITY_DN24710_c0_g1~~TRINITY_DN24710_c0_g1_i1.p1  ORF type:complete len:160 (+),score=52.93 TRINITY_DN24710_c0_g1_i1:440-919(+)